MKVTFLFQFKFHWQAVSPPARLHALFPVALAAADSPRGAASAAQQLGFGDASLRFLCGAISGATAKTLIAPLDRVKIIFQVSRTRFSFAGVGQELSRTYATEGIRGLFKGNGAQIIRVCPYSGIQLLSFDVYCRALLAKRRAADGSSGSGSGSNIDVGASAAAQLTSIERVAAGAAAGATSVICTYPLDLLRARLAVMRESPQGAAQFRGLYSAAKDMVKKGGMVNMYRGLTPTLLGILPYAGISYSTFEWLKQWSRSMHHGLDPSTRERLLFGGVAGFMGQASTYPLDIVRRRMQTEGYTPNHAHNSIDTPSSSPSPSTSTAASAATTLGSNDERRRNGVFRKLLLNFRWKEGGAVDTLTRVYSTEGFQRGLFKGLSLNAIKGPIAVGVSFTTYDLLKKALRLEGGGEGRGGHGGGG